jgi:hypothetical protein
VFRTRENQHHNGTMPVESGWCELISTRGISDSVQVYDVNSLFLLLSSILLVRLLWKQYSSESTGFYSQIRQVIFPIHLMILWMFVLSNIVESVAFQIVTAMKNNEGRISPFIVGFSQGFSHIVIGKHRTFS